MGFFDWLFRGAPNNKNLAWVEAPPHNARLAAVGSYSNILMGERGEQRVVYHSWTTGSGKNQTTHFRTFFIAPLPYSLGTVNVSPRGCSWFSKKGPHDFDTFSVAHQGDALLGDVLDDLRTATRNLRPARIEIGPHGLFFQMNRFLVQPDVLGPFMQNGLWLHPRVARAKLEDQRRDEKYFESLRLPGRARVTRAAPWAPIGLSLDAITGPARLELNAGYQPKTHLLPPGDRGRWALPDGLVFEAPLQSRGTLKLFPQRFWHALPKLFGYQDLKFGDEAFDKTFVVKSNDDRFARDLLNGDTRRVALKLRELGGDSFLLDLTLRSLVVKLGKFQNQPAELQAVVTAGLALLERFAVVAGLSGGVTFEAVEAAPGVCQVCGTPMEKAVHCDKCRTPHHPECWEYMGRCSTFACGGSTAQ